MHTVGSAFAFVISGEFIFPSIIRMDVFVCECFTFASNRKRKLNTQFPKHLWSSFCHADDEFFLIVKMTSLPVNRLIRFYSFFCIWLNTKNFISKIRIFSQNVNSFAPLRDRYTTHLVLVFLFKNKIIICHKTVVYV